MPAGVKYVCSHCRYLVEGWEGGHPYFRSDAGKPQLLSPRGGEAQVEACLQQSEGRGLTGPERAAFLAQRMGTMTDLLCLDCGGRFQLDLEKQKPECPRRKCASINVCNRRKLEGKKCPSCKTGRFRADGRISE